MIVVYSKSFQKTVDKLSGKKFDAIVNVIIEVKNAESIEVPHFLLEKEKVE